MKFDGYFVLSDYVESTNLYQKSQTAVLSKMGWLFQGSSSTEPTNLLLLGYGTAIVLWRIAICIGIFIAFSLMGEGIGLVPRDHGLSILDLSHVIERHSGSEKVNRTDPMETTLRLRGDCR